MPYQKIAELLDSLGVAMCAFDAQDRTLVWNEHFLMFFPEHAGHVFAGEPYSDNLRRFYLSRLQPEERPQIERYVQDGVKRHREQTRPYAFTHKGRKLRAAATPQPNGDRIRVWTDLSVLETESFELRPLGLHVSDAHQTPDALRFFDHLSDGLAVHDAQGRILFANDRFVELYQLRSQEDALGRVLEAVVREQWKFAQSDEVVQHAADLDAALKDSLQFSGVPFELPMPDGRWLRVTASPTAGQQACSTHVDISREKRSAAEIHQLNEQLRLESHRDALTGLLNRRGLMPILYELSETPEKHSLLYVDLDGFKQVNDAGGHAVGDEVLEQVSARLVKAVRENDHVVRLGGDEFVVVLKACDEPKAIAVAQKVVDLIGSTPYQVRDTDFRIGASVGLRTFCGSGDSPQAILHDADMACYQAKRSGRGRIHIR